MKPGQRIVIKKGARIFFAKTQTMTLDRDIPGTILTVQPDGSPDTIDLGKQITVKSGLFWKEGKDYEAK